MNRTKFFKKDKKKEKKSKNSYLILRTKSLIMRIILSPLKLHWKDSSSSLKNLISLSLKKSKHAHKTERIIHFVHNGHNYKQLKLNLITLLLEIFIFDLQNILILLNSYFYKNNIEVIISLKKINLEFSW